jgi:predicted nucleic acid-binding protein
VGKNCSGAAPIDRDRERPEPNPDAAIDATAATVFDQLRQNKKLKKIGRGDLLIAAITLANRATLVTRNLKDFRQVPGLQVEN